MPAIVSCGGGGEDGISRPDTTTVQPVPELVLPGTVSGPDTSGTLREIDPEGFDAALIYYWIPLLEYEESESDLRFLAAIQGGGSVLVLPVQFDIVSRNHAQAMVNDLGISLTVCLGDTALLHHMSPDVMPLTLLVRPEGVERETGFGGPERLLVQTGTGGEQ